MEQNDIQQNLKGKNWVATMMLCWSLGSLGAHRFYTKKTISAWVMAILTVTVVFSPISAIWALVDGVIIALGFFKHSDGSTLYERIDWLANLYIGMIILVIVTIAAMLAFISALGGFVQAHGIDEILQNQILP